MVQDNDLSGKSLSSLGGVIFGVGGDVSALDVLDGDVLDVEANIVTGFGLKLHVRPNIHKWVMLPGREIRGASPRILLQWKVEMERK